MKIMERALARHIDKLKMKKLIDQINRVRIRRKADMPGLASEFINLLKITIYVKAPAHFFIKSQSRDPQVLGVHQLPTVASQLILHIWRKKAPKIPVRCQSQKWQKRASVQISKLSLRNNRKTNSDPNLGAAVIRDLLAIQALPAKAKMVDHD